MIEASPLVKAIKAKGHSVWFSGDSHLVLDCPECKRERKLYYNYKKHIGDCKVCQRYFRLMDLYEYFQLSALHKSAPKLTDIKRRLKDLSGEKLVPVLSEVSLPEESTTILPIIARNFLNERKVPPSQWRYLYWCPSGFYGNSIIIPIKDETDRTVGFQARYLLKKEKDKYRFNKGATKRFYIFNRKYLILDRVYVVENAFNAMWMYGVTTFGKQISEEQIQALSKCRELCIIWDNDAWKEERTWKTLHRLKQVANVRAIMLTPEKPQPDNWELNQLYKAGREAFKSSSLVYRMDLT